jgi:transposase InsO family protein
MTRRKRYSAELKREALRRANEEGVTDVLVAEELGITCSMSGKGFATTTRWSKAFFASLKRERTRRRKYRSRDEARTDVFDYIERVYNRKRRHSDCYVHTRIEVILLSVHKIQQQSIKVNLTKVRDAKLKVIRQMDRIDSSSPNIGKVI